MKKICLKILSAVAALRYPEVPRAYRYYIRDNYYCRLMQTRFLLKDRVFRKAYKTIAFQGEFDQELRYVLPFAYWHWLNGTLKKTISSKNTGVFYFFSKDHEERYTERVWELSHADYQVPNMTHGISFSYSKWARVPLMEHYRNTRFRYNKPLLIIANKYNTEWDGPPVNFFDIPALDVLIGMLEKKYQVIYNRPRPAQIVTDNSDILDLNELDWLRSRYPGVLLMEDLFEKHRHELDNFNHLQLQVYANCRHFISVHGGTAALASYFGGTNIILSVKGAEHVLNEYRTIFPALSGARILHAKSRQEVFNYAASWYA